MNGDAKLHLFNSPCHKTRKKKAEIKTWSGSYHLPLRGTTKMPHSTHHLIQPLFIKHNVINKSDTQAFPSLESIRLETNCPILPIEHVWPKH